MYKLKSTYTVYLCIHKISYWGNQGKTNKKMSSQVISWAAKPSPYALRLSPKYRVYVAISIYNWDFNLRQSPGNFLEASIWSSHVSSNSIHSSHLIFPLSHLGWGNLLCKHHMDFLQDISVSRSVVSDSWKSIDCSPPGSSVHGILQARILECVVIPFFRGSFWLRDQNQVSWIAGGFFTIWATSEELSSSTSIKV